MLRLNLQLIIELQTVYTWFYIMFNDHDYDTAQRNNKFWSELWVDLVIDEVQE